MMNNDKEQLLKDAERIAQKLSGVPDNEIKRATQHLIKHKDDSDPFGELLSLLSLTPPNRGRTREYWRTLRTVLKSEQSKLENYSSSQISFILGWAARIVGFYSG
jgi:hypothetical protein